MHVYARDNGTCQHCKRVVGKPGEAHIDHVKPKHLGGTDEIDNLQVLCASCHGRKTRAEEGGRGCEK
jgi:5-methylcytosine-specific restriction protein A